MPSCRDGYRVAKLEEERKEIKKINTSLPPNLRSDEPSLSPAIQRSKISRVALLSGILLRDSSIPKDATEIPAMRALDSDLHDKPKFETAAHQRRHSLLECRKKKRLECWRE
jgi:hypothetical protein